MRKHWCGAACSPRVKCCANAKRACRKSSRGMQQSNAQNRAQAKRGGKNPPGFNVDARPTAFAAAHGKSESVAPILQRLEKSGQLLTWEEPLTPDEDPWDTDFVPPANVLNAEQKHALAEIWRWLVAGKFEAALLHGVTGSGKTEVYLGAIEAALSRGKTAIVLVPEIALTLWVGRLVRARFGAGVAVLHSGLPDIGARARMVARAAWRGARRGGYALRCFRAARKSRARSSWTKSRNRVTSRKKRRATTGATPPSIARGSKERLRYSVPRRPRLRRITTRAPENINCSS